MSTSKSPVDAYIEKSADFARPILEHLRQVVHEACVLIAEKSTNTSEIGRS